MQRYVVCSQVQSQSIDPFASMVPSSYTELLYAHLLDSDGSRLTYTHFTSRVTIGSLVEITFNRPVYIQRNKVDEYFDARKFSASLTIVFFSNRYIGSGSSSTKLVGTRWARARSEWPAIRYSSLSALETVPTVLETG